MIWGKQPPWAATSTLWARYSDDWYTVRRAWVKYLDNWELVHGPDDWPFVGRVLLLHMNGTQGSQKFIDNGMHYLNPIARADPGPNGGVIIGDMSPAYIDTTVKKFGTGSLRTDLMPVVPVPPFSNQYWVSYLSIDNDLVWQFQYRDFTMDAWIYWPDEEAMMIYDLMIFDKDGSFRFFYAPDGSQIPEYGGHLAGIYSASGSGPDDGVCFPWVPEANRWYHVAQVRYNGIVTLYVDGVALGSKDMSAYEVGNNTQHRLYIGTTYALTQGLAANFDEMRILNGVAAWTSDFTPPSAPYT